MLVQSPIQSWPASSRVASLDLSVRGSLRKTRPNSKNPPVTSCTHVDTRNYEHFVAKVIEEVQGGVHLEGYDSRKEFVLAIYSVKVKPSLV